MKAKNAKRIGHYNGLGVWVRDTPWQENALSAPCVTGADVMKDAGLDWAVVRKPIEIGGRLDKNYIGLVKEYERDDGSIGEKTLGIVSPKYTILQNSQAFDYLDSLVGTELNYTAAGEIGGGKRVFLVAETENKWKIGDDDIGGNLLLSTGHDGWHTLQIAITPVRIFCQNCLPYAFKMGKVNKRYWRIKHQTSFEKKLNDARKALQLTSIYFENMQVWGEKLVETKVSQTFIDKFMDELFPKSEKADSRSETIRQRKKDALVECLGADDLANYRGTGWQIINAVSDYETHREQNPESLLANVLDDRLPLFHKAANLLNAAL